MVPAVPAVPAVHELAAHAPLARVYPALQLAQMAAAFVVHAVLVAGVPFVHVQVLTVHVLPSPVKPSWQVLAWAEAPAGQNLWPLFTQLVSEAAVPVAWQVLPATVKPVQPVQSFWQVLACAEAPAGQNF